MAKNIIGIDMGRDRLKIALMSGNTVRKSTIVDMPDNMIRQGQIVSVEAMSQLIRDTMKTAGIRGKSAAVLIPNDAAFVRNVIMPVMTAEQLAVNLPYECRDYISDEPNNYVFDYAMLTNEEELRRKFEAASEAKTENDDNSQSMELLAVAVQKNTLEDIRQTVRKAGMTLDFAAPAICAYANLLRGAGNADQEYCMLDLGYETIRMYMFKGDCHVVTRELEMGLSSLDDVIADAYSVDSHQAHTYLLTNHDNCLYNEVCVSFYNNVAVEIMRAINFYQFSNPDSNLDNLYAFGGGTMLNPLMDTIRQTISININFASDFVSGKENIEECNSMIQAIGVALN